VQKTWVLLGIFPIFPMQLLEDFDIIVALKGAELEYRIIAINKTGAGAVSNIVNAVL
jgi:hypothetical protein